jgi:hypothetical protein
MKLGTEAGPGGHAVGRDPRTLTHDELQAIGHEPMSPLAALRARCLDCCAGSPSEVRLCTAVRCPARPFRMGSSPWRAPASEAQREASRRNAARMHAALADPVKITGSDAATPGPVSG